HHEFAGELITLPLRIIREHEEYLSLITVLCEISTSRSQENVHVNPNDLIPPGVENDDCEDEDNELPNLDHQDNPSSPRPPPEPPDVCLNFKPDTAMKNDEDFNRGIVLSLNVEDVNSFTIVIWTFLPYFTYPEDSPVILSLSGVRTSFLTPASLLFIFLLRQFHLLSLRTNEFRDRVKLCDSVTKNKALRGRHPMLIHFYFLSISNVTDPTFSEDSRVRCFVPVHSSFLFFVRN
ncbi:hypothetical protein Tco_1258505, partial [Tanacetum coccineum]